MKFIIICLFFIFSLTANAQDVYIAKDKKNGTSFSDQPIPNASNQEKIEISSPTRSDDTADTKQQKKLLEHSADIGDRLNAANKQYKILITELDRANQRLAATQKNLQRAVNVKIAAQQRGSTSVDLLELQVQQYQHDVDNAQADVDEAQENLRDWRTENSY